MPGHRRPNPRLVKMHRSYRIEEIAELFQIHKNTVRNWIKAGLPTIDGKRPILIHGPELARFLSERRANGRARCAPGEIYCVKCRSPKRPAGDMADCIPMAQQRGRLTGICPDCGIMIHRHVSLACLEAIRGKLDISFPKPSARIS
jgi:hypothetical protein